MKIRKIYIQNLNSLRSTNPIEIDFTEDRFKEAGVFVITGATGSGKSTILDAITIALYHKVPRLIHNSSLSEVVNYGSATALATVEFKTEDEVYEASWTIRVLTRYGKRLKNPQESVRLKSLSSGKILAEKKRDVANKVEEITSLNYQQFLRAVLLAQGEFSAFLLASPKEKSSLLEQITGEDIYKKIGIKLKDKISAQNQVVEAIRATINSEDLLTDDTRVELFKRVQEIDICLNDLEKSQKRVDTLKSLKFKYASQLNSIDDSIEYIKMIDSRLCRAIEKAKWNIDIKLKLKTKEIIDNSLIQKIESLRREKDRLKKIDIELLNYNIEELKDNERYVEDKILKYQNYQELILTQKKLKELNPHIEQIELELKHKEKILLYKEKIVMCQIEILSLKKQRDMLQKDKPCPLCGSTVHPKIDEYKKIQINPLHIEIKEIKRDIKELYIRLNRLRESRTKYISTIANIQKNIKLKDIEGIDIEEYYSKIGEIKQKILEYKRLHRNRDRVIDVDGNIDITIVNLEKKLIKYREIEMKKRGKLEESIKNLRLNIKKYKGELDLNQKKRELLIKKREILLQKIGRLEWEINYIDESSLMYKRESLQQEKGQIEQQLKKDNEIRDRNRDRIEKIKKEESRLENLKTLFKLLGGSVDSFNTYVQRLTLIELINLANIHLKKFAPRYRLSLYDYKSEREALKFGLIDSYQANTLREIDTSSGGERFIISLALALGLSDLASKNVKIKSLFIDEGFGTLDSTSLDTVIQTLENLKREEKLIGIISHVESLKNRIERQIAITKSGNGLSEVHII